MAQTVLITLTTAGTNTGPFDLYSDADGYITPFEIGISKVSLQSGYLSILVPNAATIIRVQSTGDCTNYIDLNIVFTTTTSTSTLTSTTTTSTSTSTTSTTSSSTSTTSTTTTLALTQYCYTAIWQCDDGIHVPPGGSITYYDQFGVLQFDDGLCDGGTNPIFTYLSSSLPDTIGLTPTACP